MAKAVNWILLSIFAVIIIYFFMAQAYNVASPNVACEDINFVANNIYYNPDNTPVVILNGVYDDSGCSNAFPVSRYAIATNSSIRLYTNGTGAWPNITTGHHYADYDYEASATVFGLSLGFVGKLAMIGVGLAILFKMLFSKK